MSFEIVVPAFGRDPAAGWLSEWYRPDGARVTPGELLFRVERDFVAIEVEAQAEGFLRHGASEGDELEAGLAAGIILLESERPEPWPGDETAEASDQMAPPIPASMLHPSRWDRRPIPLRAEPAPVQLHREPIPFRAHEGAAPGLQSVLVMRTAVDLGEATKMCAQLTAEWAAYGVSPGLADLVVRAASRALTGVPNLPAQRDAVSLVELEGGAKVLRDAGARPFREVVSERQAGVDSNETRKAACSVAWLEPWGIDEAVPRLGASQPLGLAVGAPRETLALDGDRPVRGWQAWLSLSYEASSIPDAAAARFLGRIHDLLEAPYALLVD